MFAFLRKLIVPIMATVLVFFLMTIVFEWGMNITSKSRVTANDIGIINDQKIQPEVFGRYYTSILRQEEEKSEAELPPDKLEQIRRQAWNQMLGDVLINQEINKRRIVITDEEIFAFLRMYPPAEVQSTPQFQTDGKFDYQKYVGAMTNPQYAPYWASIESFITPELKKYKLQEEIINTIRVSPAEVMDAFMAEKEMIKFGYINLPSSKMIQTTPKPTPEQTKKYYDEHRDEFKLEDRATLQIVLFQKAPSENDWERASSQIREIYDSAMVGADFAELARNYSQDEGSAEKGGDLGWFQHEQMVPQFDSAVWALKPNEISRPVKSQFGWHIIKLLGKRIEKKVPLGGGAPTDVEEANAAHILLKVTPTQETLDQLSLNSKDLITLAEKDGFEKAAQDMKYEIRTTAPFKKKDYIQYLGSDPVALDFAFNNEPGKISDPLENSSAYYVMKVASHIPAGYAAFEEVEKNISQKLAMEKAKELTANMAKVIYAAIKNGIPMEKAGQTYGYPYAETEMINMKVKLPGMGNSPEVLGAAFALKNIDNLSEPVNYAAGSAIVKLLQKTSPNIEEFNQLQDSIRGAVLQTKQQDIYGRWFDNLVKNAEIVENVDKFYGGAY